MISLNYSISINATKEKVWDTLWNDSTYRQWTAAFTEGSYAVSDWNEGSKIQFLSPNGSGMFSVIDKKVNNKQMRFKHLGEIKNGTEELKDWGEVLENYNLTDVNGVTQLDVEVTMNANEQFETFFNNTFPKALALVKQIAES